MPHAPPNRYPEPIVCRACDQPFKGGEIAILFYKIVEAHGVVAAERITSGIHLDCLLLATANITTTKHVELRHNLYEYLDQEASS